MEPSTQLPPQLQAFAALLDLQPGPVQVAFQFCLALLMVEAGKATLVAKHPGEDLPLYTFQTVTGERFTLPRPPITRQQEAELLDHLHDLLADLPSPPGRGAGGEGQPQPQKGA